jgi:hypothetical protein
MTDFRKPSLDSLDRPDTSNETTMAQSTQSAASGASRDDMLAESAAPNVLAMKATDRQSKGPAVIAMSLPDTVGGGIAYALDLLRSRYEGNSDPDEDMPFHCAEHTAGVIHRTAALLQAMGAVEREYQMGLLAAAFHDTVQRWAPATTPDGKVLRRRFSGPNEIDSAAEAVAWMRQADGAFGEPDYELVTRAILATIPGWDAENGTVFQPHLTADAPAAVRAVALADLGIAGLDAGAFVMTGDQLFREENLDIGRALHRCATRADLGAATLEDYKARMLAWSRSQAGFARGRHARLDPELGDLNCDSAAAVRALFGGFEASIRTADEVVRVREHLPPWEVARAMGYPIPGERGSATRPDSTAALWKIDRKVPPAGAFLRRPAP